MKAHLIRVFTDYTEQKGISSSIELYKNPPVSGGSSTADFLFCLNQLIMLKIYCIQKRICGFYVGIFIEVNI